MIQFDLPWPPSVNHYYIRTTQGVILGERGRNYRELVYLLLNRYRNTFEEHQRLCITINLYPPDNRKRDIDNVAKAILDSLQYANVFPDDNQIDMLTIIRRHRVKNGNVKIWITECNKE